VTEEEQEIDLVVILLARLFSVRTYKNIWTSLKGVGQSRSLQPYHNRKTDSNCVM